MERKKSSGKPFKMRSPETPYPFLGKIVGGAVGAIKNVLPGGGGDNNSGGNADDVNTKIDEMHKALVGNNEMGGGVDESRTLATAAKQGAMPKKAGPLYHTKETRYGTDPDHKYHTHVEGSPNHPDNQTKYVINGKEVSPSQFSSSNSGLGRQTHYPDK